jgi:hypothetical protein
MPRTFLAAESDDDGKRRAAYRDQRNVVAGATYHRLTELDRRYRDEASADPMDQARHAAVRAELRQRGYHPEARTQQQVGGRA